MARRLIARSVVLVLLLLLTGCSTWQPPFEEAPNPDPSFDGEAPLAPPLHTPVVVLVKPFVPEGGGADRPEPPAPPGPDESVPPPVVADPEAEPVEPITATDALEDLKNRYKVTLHGGYDNRFVELAYQVCLQFRPEDTAGIDIHLASNPMPTHPDGFGVAGLCYLHNGRILIWERTVHVMMHEVAHYVTARTFPLLRFLPGRDNAARLLRAVNPHGKPVDELDPRYVPSAYSMRNHLEWWADFYTYVRCQDMAFPGRTPLPDFDPDDAVLATARELFAGPPDTNWDWP